MSPVLSPTMSDQPGNNGDREPLSKRQKCGDGGPMYDEATARKMLEEVVLVSAEDAEYYYGETLIGFDPDDAALDNVYDIADGFADVTPMTHFARTGDAKMCRYLASRGASTTKSSSLFGPMYLAARHGQLEVCKFLQANGASNDIWKEMSFSGWVPLHTALVNSRDEVVRWLVLQGALCANGSTGTVEGGRIYPKTLCNDIQPYRRQNRNKMSSSYKGLVDWAEEVTQSHSALVMFLLGTLPPPPGKDQSRIIQCLSGHPGVRKHIGDFVGLKVTKVKQLCILRQVVDVLPSFIRTDDEE